MNYGIYYFNMLTPDQQERYKINRVSVDLTFEKIMYVHKWNGMAQMLMASFSWYGSNEGRDYWSLIAHKPRLK